MRIKDYSVSGYLPSILLAGLLFLLPIVYWEAIKSSASFPRYLILGLYACVLLLYWIFSAHKRQPLVWHPLFYVLLLFALWASISIVWSVDPANTFNTSLQLVSFVLICFYAAQVVDTEIKLQLVLYAAIAGGILVAIIGLLQAYDLNIFEFRQSRPPASTFINKNFAAIYIDTITPLAFMAIFLTSNKRLRWLFAVCFAVILAYQILTISRGSWLAILVFLLVFVFLVFKNAELSRIFKHRLAKSRLPLVVASLLVICISWYPLQDNKLVDKKLTTTSVDSSISVRLNANINALGMVTDNPVTGVGYGAFMLGFRPYMFKYVPITKVSEYKYLFNLHNDPLQIIVELGIPGGILAIGIYLWALFLAGKILSSGNTATERIIGMGLFLSLLSFGVHALVSFPLNKPTSAMMFWVLIGITVGLYTKVSRPAQTPRPLSRIMLVGMSMFALSFLWINAQHYLHYYTNHLYLTVLEQKVISHDCEAALKIAERIDFTTKLTLRVYYPMVYGNCPPGNEQLVQKMNAVIDYDPNNSLARIIRGKHYLETHQSQLAADDFLVVISILPHKAIGYIGLGNAATQEAKYKLAEKLYRKALELEPQNETALLMLSRLGNRPH